MIWYLWVINKSLYLDHRPVNNLTACLNMLKAILWFTRLGLEWNYSNRILSNWAVKLSHPAYRQQICRAKIHTQMDGAILYFFFRAITPKEIVDNLIVTTL